MSVAIDLAVEADGWEAIPGLDGLIRRAVDAAEAGSGIAVAKDAELSILLCDDATIRPLNRDWRGFDKATNVLSFPRLLAPAPRREAAARRSWRWRSRPCSARPRRMARRFRIT